MAIRIYKDTAAQLADQLHKAHYDIDDDCDVQPIEWYIMLQKQLSRIIPEKEGLNATELISAMEEVIKLGLRMISATEMNGAAQGVVDWVRANSVTIQDDEL